MSVWRSAFLAALVAAGGCTEKLTTPGRCPVCPSRSLQMADTLLTAVDSADTTARGYVRIDEAGFVAASTLDSLKSVILLRFSPVPNNWVQTTADTVLAVFPADSVQAVIPLVFRDTTVHPRLVFYRLPATFDTTMTYAQATAYFADSVLLDTAAVPDTGTMTVPMPTSLFAAPGDSGVLAIGIKVIADSPTVVALSPRGTSSTALTYFVHGQPPRDTLHHNLIAVDTFATFAQSPTPGAPPPGVFAVGGLPSAHTIVHLALPKLAVDSVSIVRGTLLLRLAKPVVAFPHDSFDVRAYPLLRDYGPKSVLYADTNYSGHVVVHAGQTGTVELDIARILRLWGTTAGDSLPRAIELLVASEGGQLGEADFQGRTGASSPQLRLTYVKTYEYGVP